MDIAFLGTGDFAVPALEALVRAGHDVRVVISQPDRPAGRGRRVRPTPVRAAAEALGLRHIQTADVNAVSPETWLGVELGVVAAFGQKLGAGLLARVPRGFVNIHGSLLPKFRGAAPVQWAILTGEQQTGVTVFQLDERWDAGPILAQDVTAIDPLETADELHDRLAKIGARLIVETLDRLEHGRLRPEPQDPSQASRAPKLSRADGWVDFTRPAEVVARRIRGLWSWPAVHATIELPQRTEPVLLVRACVGDPDGRPDERCRVGTLVPDGTVQTGRGTIRLLEVQPAGRRVMRFEDYARGRRLDRPVRITSRPPVTMRVGGTARG